jgi:hypothetical protein
MTKWRIITANDYREYPYQPTQEEYERVGGIGEIQEILSPVAEWDKEAYCQEINEAHNSLFTQLYTERNYLTIGEVPIWEADDEFGAESLALQQWWIDTCKAVAAYLESVTEQTAQPIETFINSLPKFYN